MKRLSLLILLLLPLTVFAAGTSATIKWTDPVSYTDGTPLPVTDIASFTIAWTRPGSSIVLGTATAAGGTVQDSIPGLVCGNFSFTMSVTTTATAAYPNSTSSSTGPVTYPTGISCQPNPVTGVTAT